MNTKWDVSVDISAYLERKIELIALHQCQMPKPHRPDFPPWQRALAWGQACGCRAAEVYALVASGQAELLR